MLEAITILTGRHAGPATREVVAPMGTAQFGKMGAIVTSVERSKSQQRGEEFKARMIERLDWFDVEAAAAALACSTDRVKEYAAAGDLIAIVYEGRTLIPKALIPDGNIEPGLRGVVHAMGIESPWLQLNWLTSPNERLDERTPLASIRSDPDEVRWVAKGVGVQGGA